MKKFWIITLTVLIAVAIFASAFGLFTYRANADENIYYSTDVWKKTVLGYVPIQQQYKMNRAELKSFIDVFDLKASWTEWGNLRIEFSAPDNQAWFVVLTKNDPVVDMILEKTGLEKP